MSITSGPATVKKLHKAFPPVLGAATFEIAIRRRSKTKQAHYKNEPCIKKRSLTWDISGKIRSPVDLKFIQYSLDILHNTPGSSSYFKHTKLTEGSCILKEINDNKQLIILGSEGDFWFFHFTTYQQIEDIMMQLLTFIYLANRHFKRTTSEEHWAYWNQLPHHNLPAEGLERMKQFENCDPSASFFGSLSANDPILS